MNIKIGDFYANDHIYNDGTTEKNIILVLSTTDLENCFITETIWIVNGEMEQKELYYNIWSTDSLERKATMEETDFFKQMRDEINALSTGILKPLQM